MGPARDRLWSVNTAGVALDFHDVAFPKASQGTPREIARTRTDNLQHSCRWVLRLAVSRARCEPRGRARKALQRDHAHRWLRDHVDEEGHEAAVGGTFGMFSPRR